MLQWLQKIFQTYPELAVFLALCIGFYVGRLRFRDFTLGTVASTLLAGMLIGQMHIAISPHVQAIFFVMFLFSVGYGAGPQFFSSLQKEGLGPTFFSVALCLISVLTVLGLSLIMHYDKGQAAGLFGGSQTVSPIIGVAAGVINHTSNLSAMEKLRLINEIPVCFAITYIFGTAGANWLLTAIGPRLLGGVEQVKTACRQLEDKMGGAHGQPVLTPSNSSFNAFRVTEQSIARGKTIRELEDEFVAHGHRIFIRRVRSGNAILEASPELRLQEGDVMAVNGRRSFVLPELNIGTEVIDEELLSFPITTVTAYAIKKQSIDISVKNLALKDYMYGVIIQSITRGNTRIPMYVELTIEKGDQLELMGLGKDVDRAVPQIGYAEVSTNKTNMVFVGLGIVLGGILGALTFQLGSIPFSFSSTGVLLSGLFFGWLRAQKPTFGKIPEATLWLMENVGLAVFVAIVGINAGPGFVEGVKAMGISIFFAGMVASSTPIFVGLFLGRYLFKLHPAYILGCIAGGTASSALSGIQEALQSNLPTLGYTVSYAINNILLIIGGILLVLFV